MEGDPRNPKISLLRKYDIPIDHLTYEYVEKCSDKKELEKIIRILRSGEEGFYPDLLKVTEDRLRLFAPDSRVLRFETPILTKDSLSCEEWKTVENELLSWENEMKVIDETLDFEKTRIDTIGNMNMPSIRKVVQSVPKSKSNNDVSIPTNFKSQKIKSGDYAAWDKFDVDKELLKMDVEEERLQEQKEKKQREIKKHQKENKIKIENIDKESYSSMEQQVLANQARDRGNECYKSGDYANALKYYELSIKLHANLNAYNNRAMTYLKLKKYDKAVADCNIVLSMEENNIKALQRRATAYQNIPDETNHYEMLAVEDLNKVVFLEPNNKLAQADLQKLKKKLCIEDVGKKFRMPIYENELSWDSVKSKKIEIQNMSLPRAKGADASKNVDKLPLTYYGPSTSAFQCEPFSMTHHALSGSIISNEVMCKCNSSRPRQNPLCQRCGEAVSTPKPSLKILPNKKEKKPSATENAQLRSTISETHSKRPQPGEREMHPNQIKYNEVAETKSNEIKTEIDDLQTLSKVDQSADESLRSVQVSKTKILPDDIEKINCAVTTNHLAEATTDLGTGESGLSVDSGEKPESTETITNSNDVQVPMKNVSLSSRAKNESEEPKKENDSSQMVGSNPTKTKTKKKKSKERKQKKIRKQLELVEPIKIVRADKYIHPTSAEPKVKTDPPKAREQRLDHLPATHFKPFVPNRPCLSIQRDDSVYGICLNAQNRKPFECVAKSNPSQSDFRENSSIESDKENLMKSDNINLCESRDGMPSKSEATHENFNSAFEFVKAWEQHKKMDASYAKRAEIIRLIRPADLGKVIGIKLDSDMLSSLLECLDKHFVRTDPKVVVEFLNQLPHIPRFGLVKMFLADKDKKIMKSLITAAESQGFQLDEDAKKDLALTS